MSTQLEHQINTGQIGILDEGQHLEGISLRLLDRRYEAADVISLRFEPDQPLNFQAGQYLCYTIPHSSADDRGIERYFTISSAPSESVIMLTTRLSSPGSSFKQALSRLEPGTLISVDRPAGEFVFSQAESKSVFIAGGIGITPFRSMLVELAALGSNADITLLYANRTPDIPFKTLLDGLAQVNPRLKLVYIVSEPTADWTGLVGQIDAEFIAQHVPDLATPLFYVSGPKPMVKAMGRALTGLGAPRDRIKRDGFPGYDE